MSFRFLACAMAMAFAPLVLADEPLEPRKSNKLPSSSPACWAYSDADTNTTTAYRVLQDGTKAELWKVPGWHRVAAVSKDCRLLVTGYDGMNLLPIDYDRDTVLLTFYNDGKLVRQVRLHELIADLSKLRRTQSHWYWGDYVGVENDRFYRVVTVDRGPIVFDMRTGLPTQSNRR